MSEQNLNKRERYIASIKSKLYNEKFHSNWNETLSEKRESEINEYIKELSKRKIIPNSTISLFYDDPKRFFSTFKNLLSANSLFDFNGTSIFEHYFYILFTKKHSEFQIDIYEKNFDNFFKEFGQYLSIKDEVFDTPLHKLLIKFKNKKLFFEICKKLKDIGVLNEKLLTSENAYFKSCYNIIVDEIILNKRKIIENEFQIYSNFLGYYPNLKNSLPITRKFAILTFLSKVIIDEQKLYEININESIARFQTLFNKLEDKKEIFKCIYNPISGINQLNIIFEGCTSEDNFQKLNEFVLELTKIKIEDKKDKKINDLFDQCVAKHINYVIRNMKKTKEKGDLGINYGLFLIDKVLPLLLNYNKSKNSKNILYEKIIKVKKNRVRKNRGLLSNLINNQNINLEKKIEIFKKINSILKINLKSIINKTKDISLLLLYLFVYKEECIKQHSNTNEGNAYEKIFDDFHFVTMIYLEVYSLCNKYHKDKANIFIQKLDAFFMKNYSDLTSQYKDIYGLSEENQKILVDFIIKYESNYMHNYDKEKTVIDFKADPKKKISKFEIWYSKFILTQPDLFYSLLIDINNDEKKEEKNDSDKEEEEEEENNYKYIYAPKMRLTLLRLYLLFKYIFDDVSNNPEYVSLFNEKLGENYLNINKNEILNLFLSINDDCNQHLCDALLENLESIIVFQDEDEINDEIYIKRIKWNIIIIQKISNEIEDTKIGDSLQVFQDMKEQMVFRKELENKNINYLLKLIDELKNQKTSLANISKSSQYLLRNLFYILMKIYFSFFIEFKGIENYEQNKIDIIYEEIKDLVVEFKKINRYIYHIYLEQFFTIFDSYTSSKSKKFFSSHMSIIHKKILNMYNNIDFSIIESYLNKCIFYWFYLFADYYLDDEYSNRYVVNLFQKRDLNLNIHKFFLVFVNSFY